MSFLVLTFDGGGICGLLSLGILKRLQRECSALVGNAALLSGTSTGGLIALGLAQGDEADDLIEIYETEGPVIFDKASFGAGGVVRCRYSNKGYQDLLWEYFGKRKLGGLSKNVAIPTFCVNSVVKGVHRWKPKVYVNFPDTEPDRTEFCAKVAMYTSAAPTYFPIVDYHIDGGVVANNPSMCALASALAMGNRLEDIRLLSFGTGIYPQSVKSENGAWGLTQWGSTLVDIMIGGTELVQDYQCRAILKDKYLRIDPVLPKKIPLDDWRSCPLLKEIANEYDLGPAIEWIKREWDCDQKKRSSAVIVP